MLPLKKILYSQNKALGHDDFPDSINIEGQEYQLEKGLKHSFAVAVAIYERNGEKMIVKIHRRKPFFGIPLKWLGEIMARYENAALKYCCGIYGVPKHRVSDRETAVVHDYIPGHSLTLNEHVEYIFFDRMFEILDQIHERGIAYVDMEKSANILKGNDSYPYFIDFQLAFYWPDHMPLGNSSLIRLIREWLQRCDRYHAYKLLRRMRPDLLSAQQYRFSFRKPWPVQLANSLLTPWRILRKSMHILRNIF